MHFIHDLEESMSVSQSLNEPTSNLGFKRPTYLGYLAILRILVGYHFLTVAWMKVNSAFPQGKILVDDFAKTLAKDPLALHRIFMLNVVTPHPAFFGHLVAYGELAIGLSFIFGCLVRVSASFAAFHNLNILLAIAWANGGPQLALNRLYIFMEIVFVLASAGLALGVDGFLKRKFPNSWLF
jgi:uncharacterized membrane protein YphA (DoxX/SURF4 family)